MQEQKTIREWYEMLPPPYREQAIENATERGHIYFNAKSLPDALDGGFNWSNSPQGFYSWQRVRNCAEIDNFSSLLKNSPQNRKPGGIVKSYTFEGSNLSMALKECVLQGKEKPISDLPEMITISDLPLIHSTQHNTTIYAHKADA